MSVAFRALAFQPLKTPFCQMIDKNESTKLTGKILIAMPGMGDPRFEKSVVFLCVHSPEETMGLMVNKTAPGLKMHELFEELKIPSQAGVGEAKVQYGGPVEGGRGFVLHTDDYLGSNSTLKVNSEFSMTADRDILEAMAEGRGPERATLMLGYTGWGPGQLEREIVQNGWLVADVTPDLVFGADNSGKWTAALKTLGIDPVLLSSTGGRA